ncbi:MAG: FAD-dependent oxidoreductase [Pseudonocardia sp.]|nr:FAD-dependent oxidoreductase [Pseudonocardia sp.]
MPSSVLVVGAGTAGVRAAATLRERGFDGRIVLAGAEDAPPYQRPPLSKQQLSGPTGPVPLRGPAFWAKRGIELVTGDPVVDLDLRSARGALRSGRTVGWDRVVLATGASARPLPVPGGQRALALRTAADAEELGAALRGGAPRRVVVVGGGFLGLEVAAAARTLGHDVAVVEVAPQLLARVVSVPCADHVAALHRDRGVVLHLGRGVTFVTQNGRPLVRLDDGTTLSADVVVAAVGAWPDARLATAAALDTGPHGIVVDAHLRTSDPRVYAVGDCAAPVAAPDGSRSGRVETVQNADDQGRYAALHLLGETVARYSEVPWGWTAQFGTTLQTVGGPAGHDRTVVLGDPSADRFSVLCFTGDRRCAGEAVNAPGDHVAARRMLAAGRPPTPTEAARPGFTLAPAAACHDAPIIDRVTGAATAVAE